MSHASGERNNCPFKLRRESTGIVRNILLYDGLAHVSRKRKREVTS